MRQCLPLGVQDKWSPLFLPKALLNSNTSVHESDSPYLRVREHVLEFGQNGTLPTLGVT